MPDVSYTFHTPHPPDGQPKTVGIIRVDLDHEQVAVETFKGEDFDQSDLQMLDFSTWEETLRAQGIVITPLIERAGAAVKITGIHLDSQTATTTIGCLVPPAENDGRLFDANGLTYHALLNRDMMTARVFFVEILAESLLPIGEILYLHMEVLEEARFREMGRAGKVLYTRLDIPHVRNPEIGKLYVTCLYQPRGSNRRSSKSASAITLAVNPWDVQLASQYTGDPSNVIKNLY